MFIKFSILFLYSSLLLIFCCTSADRVYDTMCPPVAPMPDFDIEKFLGVWYQVQPGHGSDASDLNEQEIPSCEFYNLKHSNKEKFIVDTRFELYTEFVDSKPLIYETVSINHLSVYDENSPAKMNYSPPAVPTIIESNFTVHATDYETYAIISNCDKEISDKAIQFTQHATIWSRTRDLENNFVDNLYESVGPIDFDPYDLSDINTTGCIEGGTKLGSINLDNYVQNE